MVLIQSSGIIGGYRWNGIRKKAIIGWEAALTEAESHFNSGLSIGQD